jgi:hypothetical protein
MRLQYLWKNPLVLLTVFSVALPNLAVSGNVPAGQEVRRPALQIRDVTLDADGVLSGYLVDIQGRPQADVPVAIHQGRKQVALTKTSAKGQFEARGLKGGVYQVSSEKGASLFRVWKNGTAPKQASKLALVVTDQGVVRAQTEGGFLGLGGGGGLGGLGGVSLTTVGIGAGIIAGTTIAVIEANDNSN